ncbi:MAG: MaoC/PaaZ C-terminal domain-containing protein [Alphaproteobacteria bacterium]|nr:MaoC family dehydratase [Rhodospirillaceae bacterium]MDG2479278.1 MaoC/PaaZ C-terminal domain-containing protein [Alphaproteobacteria bacterium]MBT6202159.1 MaoC family dehydratase [Rhodospirillaceae bacterium]MBT6509914.1 MaoC family dehydratase [Rhodospirillaceae bacterium]MBT7614743.1 MaoC family dehydratase [Rhodospirillaceae bacterium]
MTAPLFHLDEGPGLVGTSLGHSPWVTLDQEHVTMFCEATRDDDWGHLDVERSKREMPYGGTIVQGFLMLSSLIPLHHAMGLPPGGTGLALNYGTDRVRYTDVVLTGSKVRVAVELMKFEPKGDGWLMVTHNIMEVEGKERPCMIADYLVFLYAEEA